MFVLVGELRAAVVMTPPYCLCLRDVLTAGVAGRASSQAQPDRHMRLSHAACVSWATDARLTAGVSGCTLANGRCAAGQAARRGRRRLAPAHAVRHGGGRAVAPAAHALGRALPGERAHAGQHRGRALGPRADVRVEVETLASARACPRGSGRRLCRCRSSGRLGQAWAMQGWGALQRCPEPARPCCVAWEAGAVQWRSACALRSLIAGFRAGSAPQPGCFVLFQCLPKQQWAFS